MEVAAGVHADLQNKEIAARMGIAETTVKTHLHRIFQKLGRGRVGVGLWYERKFTRGALLSEAAALRANATEALIQAQRREEMAGALEIA